MDFENGLKAARKARKDLVNCIEDYTTKIAKLTQQGTSSGKPHWKKNTSKKTGETIEYMYIIYPMKDGKRRKEYIGNQQYKIDQANARMERYKLRAEYIETLSKLERQLSQADWKIQQLLDVLKDGNLYSFY